MALDFYQFSAAAWDSMRAQTQNQATQKQTSVVSTPYGWYNTWQEQKYRQSGYSEWNSLGLRDTGTGIEFENKENEGKSALMGILFASGFGSNSINPFASFSGETGWMDGPSWNLNPNLPEGEQGFSCYTNRPYKEAAAPTYKPTGNSGGTSSHKNNSSSKYSEHSKYSNYSEHSDNHTNTYYYETKEDYQVRYKDKISHVNAVPSEVNHLAHFGKPDNYIAVTKNQVTLAWYAYDADPSATTDGSGTVEYRVVLQKIEDRDGNPISNAPKKTLCNWGTETRATIDTLDIMENGNTDPLASEGKYKLTVEARNVINTSVMPDVGTGLSADLAQAIPVRLEQQTTQKSYIIQVDQNNDLILNSDNVSDYFQFVLGPTQHAKNMDSYGHQYGTTADGIHTCYDSSKALMAKLSVVDYDHGKLSGKVKIHCENSDIVVTKDIIWNANGSNIINVNDDDPVSGYIVMSASELEETYKGIENKKISFTVDVESVCEKYTSNGNGSKTTVKSTTTATPVPSGGNLGYSVVDMVAPKVTVTPVSSVWEKTKDIEVTFEDFGIGLKEVYVYSANNPTTPLASFTDLKNAKSKIVRCELTDAIDIRVVGIDSLGNTTDFDMHIDYIDITVPNQPIIEQIDYDYANDRYSDTAMVTIANLLDLEQTGGWKTYIQANDGSDPIMISENGVPEKVKFEMEQGKGYVVWSEDKAGWVSPKTSFGYPDPTGISRDGSIEAKAYTVMDPKGGSYSEYSINTPDKINHNNTGVMRAVPGYHTEFIWNAGFSDLTNTFKDANSDKLISMTFIHTADAGKVNLAQMGPYSIYIQDNVFYIHNGTKTIFSKKGVIPYAPSHFMICFDKNGEGSVYINSYRFDLDNATDTINSFSVYRKNVHLLGVQVHEVYKDKPNFYSIMAAESAQQVKTDNGVLYTSRLFNGIEVPFEHSGDCEIVYQTNSGIFAQSHHIDPQLPTKPTIDAFTSPQGDSPGFTKQNN